MFIIQIYVLILVGIIGIIFNWLLILAIQRKTYHYQYTNRIPSPMNMSILRSNSLSNQNIVHLPLLPSVRSSISIFDKFILAFLLNDIFVCNFLLPLRILDMTQGLPCAFLCFLFKLIENITTTSELIIINLLLITSLIHFWKNRLLTTKFRLIYFFLMIPIAISCLITTLTYIEVDENDSSNRSSTCRQTFIYVNVTTAKTLNIFCYLVKSLMLIINVVLLIRTKSAIKVYKKNALKSLTDGVLAPRIDVPSVEQSLGEPYRRRSMYYAASITIESSITSITSPHIRSHPPIDYNSYLTVMENSQTLVHSTCVILLIYLLVYIPYWLYEFFNNEILSHLKDLFFLCHVIKPFCYMLTNEKYRHHVWAILQCKTFRMLPTLLRRKSRLLTFNDRNNFSISNNY